MSATCVVVAFHRPRPLAVILDELRHPDLDLVVVNVEADAEVRSVASIASALVVDVRDNCGYAKAVNHGVAFARREVVVFLNDDARIKADDVLRLAGAVLHGEADVAVPRVVDADGILERTVAPIPDLWVLMREWMLLPDEPVGALVDRVPVQKWRAPVRPERIDAAAAIVVATTTALLRAQPLPESYFLYWEESHWFWRLRERGLMVQYRPDVTCMHDGGRGDIRPAKSRLLARNAVRCVRLTQGRWAALAAIPVVCVWNLRLLLTDLARLVTRPSRARWVRLRARATGLWAAVTSWGELR